MKNLTIITEGQDKILRVQIPHTMYTQLVTFSQAENTMITSEQARALLTGKGYLCKSYNTHVNFALRYRVDTEVRGNKKFYNRDDLNKIPAKTD